MFSNIEETYDKLPKHLISAFRKLFYCFSRGAKNGRIAKIANRFFSVFLNLHNFLESACNHIKFYML